MMRTASCAATPLGLLRFMNNLRPSHLVRRAMPVLACTLAISLAPAFARAQNAGTITITDLDVGRITATEVGGPGNANTNLTADINTPETISGSIDIDGTVTGGTGYAILKEWRSKDVSDLLTVRLTPRGLRGNGQAYYTASWTFLSDTDNTPIDLSTLGLSDDVVKAINAAGIEENGNSQAMDGILVDSQTGAAFGVPNLSIMVQSRMETPEPGACALVGASSIAALSVLFRRRRRR